MYTASYSLTVDRLIARWGWPRWSVLAIIGVILILLPIAVIYLDVGTEGILLLTHGPGWHLFFYPLMILYLLSVIGPMQMTREGVAQALRPLTLADDSEFAAVASRACRVRPVSELLAFGAGVLFFFGIEGRYTASPEYRLTSLYAYSAGLIMFGVIGWSIYGGFTITTLTNQLLRLPVQIDIFDTEALAPIGRQSLSLALTFVGATLLSLIFVVPTDNLRNFFSIDNIIIYTILIVLTFAIFYLNMHRTHALLTTAKNEQLKRTDDCLAQAYYKLHDLIAKNQDTNAVSIELNALAIGKREVMMTRTWPYDTATLRTLFVSVFAPLMVAFSRIVISLISS